MAHARAAQAAACQLVITGARLYSSPHDPLVGDATIVIDRLLDGDPAADIAAFSRVLMVVRDGHVIYRH